MYGVCPAFDLNSHGFNRKISEAGRIRSVYPWKISRFRNPLLAKILLIKGV
mgnify:CR=1